MARSMLRAGVHLHEDRSSFIDPPFMAPLDIPSRAIVINLPFPPSVNGLFANVPGKGRSRSQRYREWSNAAGWALKEQRPGGITGPVDLTMWFEERTDRRRDLGNLEKAVTDLLVEHQVIEADDHSIVRSITLCWSPSVKGCRVCVSPKGGA